MGVIKGGLINVQGGIDTVYVHIFISSSTFVNVRNGTLYSKMSRIIRHYAFSDVMDNILSILLYLFIVFI
jgi:hypothetical protein